MEKTKDREGEWLSPEEFRRKKDIERRDYLLRELEIVNRRLNPRSHQELKKEFVTSAQKIKEKN